MSFEITYSNRFKKHFQKLNEKEKNLFRNKLKLFLESPTYPSFRTKKIRGLDDTFESSLNMDIRIIWSYEEDKLILMLDIGHHDVLNKL